MLLFHFFPFRQQRSFGFTGMLPLNLIIDHTSCFISGMRYMTIYEPYLPYSPINMWHIYMDMTIYIYHTWIYNLQAYITQALSLSLKVAGERAIIIFAIWLLKLNTTSGFVSTGICFLKRFQKNWWTRHQISYEIGVESPRFLLQIIGSRNRYSSV